MTLSDGSDASIPAGEPASEPLRLRLARPGDVPDLQRLIEDSVRGLVARDYDAAQIESSLRHVFSVDSTLIADGTYYVVELEGRLLGCGGWSRRRTPFGGDQAHAVHDVGLRDPAVDAAVMRAFFVHPDWSGHGLGRMILDACESAARQAGFGRFELVATLTGVPFYAARGYHPAGLLDHTLPDGTVLRFERMEKAAPPAP